LNIRNRGHGKRNGFKFKKTKEAEPFITQYSTQIEAWKQI